MTKKITKEKQEQLDNLSKKYFWEQKTTEVSIFVLIVLGLIASFYISSSIFLMVEPEGVSCPSIEWGYCTGVFVTGFMGFFLCMFGLGMLFGIGYGIYGIINGWIKSNKKKAEKRAKDELGIKYSEYDYW